ncbi:MAG: hypothetical protein LBC40_03100, partial [Dysgonamonadaceae bacterium]|nr:hypothetical protein [Dysgonamonadaceae bacterium]
NTAYSAKAELYAAGGTKFAEYTATFTTWNPNPPIGQTKDINTYFSAQHNYFLNGVKGTPTAWIKVTGTLNSPLVDYENAIRIYNCQYVILEGITVVGGNLHAVYINETSADIRIVNCDISGWGRVSTEQTDKGEYVDAGGAVINNDAGVYIHKAKNVVVEKSYIHDSKAKANPWRGTVKLGPHAGKTFKEVHPKGPTGIFVGAAKGGIVLRYNDIVGSQENRFNDVIESAQNGREDGGFATDADIYGNMMCFGQDDCIELDGGQCNIRTFNNRMEQAYDGISTAPNIKGPSYIFNNVIFNLGDENKYESVAVKNGGGAEYATGRQFFFHNTFMVTRNVISGVGYGSSTSNDRAGYLATTRNNLLASGQISTDAKWDGSSSGDAGSGLSISDRVKGADNDFDYDLIANTTNHQTGTGEAGEGRIYAKNGSEPHGVFAAPGVENYRQGVFTLKYDNAGIDRGTVIPNFTERFHGSAPDMGAFELCSSSLIPIRPLDMVADKYSIELTAGTPEKITLFTRSNIPSGAFTIRKSADMSWLTVNANASQIAPNTEIELTLTAVKTTTLSGRQAGAIIVRMNDGLSLPITVFVK